MQRPRLPTFLSGIGSNGFGILSPIASDPGTGIAAGASVTAAESTGSHIHSGSLTTVPTPLINGRALSVAYLEWLVLSGGAPSNMHDEYAQLLIEGIPLQVYVFFPPFPFSFPSINIKLYWFLSMLRFFKMYLYTQYLPPFLSSFYPFFLRF